MKQSDPIFQVTKKDCFVDSLLAMSFINFSSQQRHGILYLVRLLLLPAIRQGSQEWQFTLRSANGPLLKSSGYIYAFMRFIIRLRSLRGIFCCSPDSIFFKFSFPCSNSSPPINNAKRALNLFASRICAFTLRCK